MSRNFFPRPRVSDEGHRVTTFELLFDLVYVFAFTQVTQLMAQSHSALGVLQAMIILGLLWWSWCAYGWLANQTHVDEGLVRIGMSVAMIAMFVLALAIPEAFDDHPGGLWSPLVLVIAYAVVRTVHIVLYLIAAGSDAALRRQILKTSTSWIASVAVLLVGALVGGTAQTWIWLASIAADLLLTYLTSSEGSWRVHSAAHWAERHGLVVILALGESVVSIGAGAAHHALSVPILAGSVLAVILAIALWWLYFDETATAAEKKLAAESGVARVSMATDAYTYLHLPLIAGIVIAALGVEDVVAHSTGNEALGLFGACALFGGTSLYLVALALFRRRVGGTFSALRLAGGALLLVLVPVGAALLPLVALAAVVGVVVAVVLVEFGLSPRHSH